MRPRVRDTKRKPVEYAEDALHRVNRDLSRDGLTRSCGKLLQTILALKHLQLCPNDSMVTATQSTTTSWAQASAIVAGRAPSARASFASSSTS